jgi:hypothetical protein
MKESKKIEQYLIDLMKGGTVVDNDTYTKTAILIFKNLVNNGVSNFEKPNKPKVKTTPTYSNKCEPKTDIHFYSNDKEYKLSIKKDSTAYIVSCNSQEDFIKVFIDIFNGYEVLDSEMISLLKKASSKIGKIPNFYSFDRSYKGDVVSFVKDKFLPKASKYVSREKADAYSNYIIDCYNNQDYKDQYINYLNSAESFLQSVIQKLFIEYPDYSKKIIFELITGNIKFSNSICSSNYVTDDSGLYILDDYNCEYVNITYNKYLNNRKAIRLQNVPRKTINKGTLLSGDLKMISEQFSVADLTFKI